MAISRMQQPRQLYGLGSFVKKAVRKVTKPVTKVAKKIVPKEVAGIMRAAAPFLPPGYREAAYLLGTAKQTGRISPVDLALAAAPTIGKMQIGDTGQTIGGKLGSFNMPFAKEGTTVKDFLVGGKQAVGMGDTGVIDTQGIFGSGGKMFQFGDGQGFTAFKDQTKLGDLVVGGKEPGTFSKSKIAGLGLGVLSLIQSAKTPEEAGNLLVSRTGNSDDYQRGFDLFSQLDTSSFAIPDQFRLNSAKGGLMRTNYAMGSDDEPLPNDPTEPVNPFRPKPLGPFPSKMAEIPKGLDLEKAKEMFIEFNGREPVDMQELLEFFNVKPQAANGGIMRNNYALGDMAMNQAPSMNMGVSPNLGSRPTKQESGLGGLPIEADMRYTGGFMPYGAVEKADDVPARLSKNEFVFTADAVRAAGGGSVQKGAKKMYDTMKQLEKKT